ncbi:MAG: preprotein translocase subunit SecA, partial [Pirellulales bacterium]|nr:preprotein translocase subunit SecA [Pirellulales bacterium]
TTGRVYEDRTWSEGLHQAVEAKEGLSITEESLTLAQITRQRFARFYPLLAGMTGTATGCEREFRSVYGLKIQSIPLRVESKRRLLPARFFATQQAKRAGIAESVKGIHAEARPVLIGTRSISESELLASVIEQHGIPVQILNGRQDAQEADIVAAAGQLGAVTISTNLAGRGTDIKLGEGVRQLGGLHVVVSECNESHRMDRQLIGRCARQGDPGSAQFFTSAEDALLVQFGPWLAKTIERHANAQGEADVDVMSHLLRLQRVAERQACSVRKALFRDDLMRDSVYAEK